MTTGNIRQPSVEMFGTAAKLNHGNLGMPAKNRR